MNLDIETLTIDELDLLEDVAGADLEDIQAGKVKASKAMRAFALIALRRDNPGATVEDAGKVTVAGLNDLLGDAAPLGSPPAARSASPGSSPSRKRQGSR